MKNYAKVEGHQNLVRDLNTNAIINTDKNYSNSYTLAKKKREEELQRIDNLENELSDIKLSINEIKNLLWNLCNES